MVYLSSAALYLTSFYKCLSNKKLLRILSDFSLTLVLQIKTSKIISDMAKVQIKSERVTPFGGIFHVRELFTRFVGPVMTKYWG